HEGLPVSPTRTVLLKAEDAQMRPGPALLGAKPRPLIAGGAGWPSRALAVVASPRVPIPRHTGVAVRPCQHLPLWLRRGGVRDGARVVVRSVGLVVEHVADVEGRFDRGRPADAGGAPPRQIDRNEIANVDVPSGGFDETRGRVDRGSHKTEVLSVIDELLDDQVRDAGGHRDPRPQLEIGAVRV